MSSRLDASLIGSTVDGFAIEGVVGGGSFATVYRARQTGLDRLVALKVPSHEIAADPVMAKRFAREARAASRVHHPGVVAIYAVGQMPDERPYLAMELVEGESLERALDEGPLEPIRALRIARAIASALSETHAAEVVHRDLKPSNIVWRRDRNGDDRMVIVDFGIAVSKPGSADATRLTQNGLIGTPHYMSPEQAQGETVDARSDLYALGCILFELVTQDTLYSGSGYEVLLAHMGRPAPVPSARNPNVPTVIDDLCLKLLAKRKESRLPNAEAVIAEIDRSLAILEGRPVPPAHVVVVPPHEMPARATGPTLALGRVTDDDALEDDVAREKSVVNLPMAGASESFVLPQPSRGRWLVGGLVIGALAASAVTYALVHRAPVVATVTEEPSEGSQARREVLLDSGDVRLRLWVPEPLVVGRAMRFRLELRNKLGNLIAPDQVVVTVEDAAGKAVGLAARPREQEPSQFRFQHTFPARGHYVMRVFPPETEADFELSLDVP